MPRNTPTPPADPELRLMLALGDEIANTGPVAGAKLVDALARVLPATLALADDSPALGRVMSWAQARTTEAAAEARAKEARKKADAEAADAQATPPPAGSMLDRAGVTPAGDGDGSGAAEPDASADPEQTAAPDTESDAPVGDAAGS